MDRARPAASRERRGSDASTDVRRRSPQGSTVGTDPRATLHRSVGNRAMLARRERRQSVSAAEEHAGGDGADRPAALAREGSRTRLTVSDPGDATEREAERVARRVTGADPDRGDRIRGLCPRCRRRHRRGLPLECESCETTLQRRERSGGFAEDSGSPAERPGGAATDRRGVARQLPDLRGRGRPLTESERSFFEPRFGTDFGDVRVHTGTRADDATRAVNADAFAVGRDVVLRSGAYRPGTSAGRRLLAHELTHVVQSRESAGSAGELVLSRQQRPGQRSSQNGNGQPGASPLFSLFPTFQSPPPCGRPLEVYPIIDYIRQEMETNEGSSAVQRMRELNDYTVEECVREWQNRGLLAQVFGPGPEDCASRVLSMRASALTIWVEKVRTNGPWDHKPVIRSRFTRPGLQQQVYHQLDKWGYYYDIWSNIHYGYVGAAAGFDKEDLLDGAGLEQIGSTILSGSLPERSEGTSGLEAFDDPSDRLAVELGYDFYPGVPSTVAIAQVVLDTSGLTRKLAECCRQNPGQC